MSLQLHYLLTSLQMPWAATKNAHLPSEVWFILETKCLYGADDLKCPGMFERYRRLAK